MKTKVLIVGGGISGLIMAYELHKRGIDYSLVEREVNGAPEAKVHYLHSDLSTRLPIPMRPVDIITNVLWNGAFHRSATIEMMNYFAYTTLGRITQNSMKYIDGGIKKGWVPTEPMNKSILGKIHAEQEHDAANNFQGQLLQLEGSKARFHNTPVGPFYVEYETLISTIPLPILLATMKLNFPGKFRSEPIKMTEIHGLQDFMDDIFQVVYIPQAEFGYARYSILGDRIVAEKANGNFEATEGANRIGLRRLMQYFLPGVDLNNAKFEDTVNPTGRFIPVQETFRLELMKSLKAKRIICLGRYAEWTYRRVDNIVNLAEEIANEFV